MQFQTVLGFAFGLLEGVSALVYCKAAGPDCERGDCKAVYAIHEDPVKICHARCDKNKDDFVCCSNTGDIYCP
ncbi:hypothetical protein K4K61_001877 [Colletotrichum sp. SAR11_59]|nr:hypothetical protein K4K61_001877 [Colletotrichum sp. SAR11_59]